MSRASDSQFDCDGARQDGRPPAVDDQADARKIHHVRGLIFGEFQGAIVEVDDVLFRAYDQTEAYIDSFTTLAAAQRAVEAAYIPPPPTPRRPA
jgi:hypothetical protein